MMLQMLLPRVAKEDGARVTLGLTECGVKSPQLDACWESLLAEGTLETLPLPMLARVAVAARSCASPGKAFDAILRATRAQQASSKWSLAETSELLLAASRAQDAQALVEFLMDGLQPQLQEFSSEQLINLMIGISSVKICRALLEASSRQLERKLSDVPPAHLLRLLKGLFGLGSNDAIFRVIGECWQTRLAADVAKASREREKAESTMSPGDTVEVFGLTSESGARLNGKTGNILTYIAEKGRFQVKMTLGFDAAESVSLNPKNLRKLKSAPRQTCAQIADGLSADNLADLLQMLAPLAPREDDDGVLEMLAERLLKQMNALTSTGVASLTNLLGSDDIGPNFEGRSQLIQSLRQVQKGSSENSNRDRSRSRGKRR